LPLRYLLEKKSEKMPKQPEDRTTPEEPAPSLTVRKISFGSAKNKAPA